ncbi:MAG: DUF5615 family PIN-like protein [Ardenticatenales bacterium]|nr:DUF5615 family PIN-like protein [Ardenticatenales bacterium]
MTHSVPDEIVLETANRDGALLVTGDTDFGELVFRQGKVSGGVILVRLAGLSARTKAAVVVSAITEHCQEMADVSPWSGRGASVSGG